MSRGVEAVRRTADGQWMLHDMTDAGALILTSIGVEVFMGEVFDGVQPAA